MKLEDALKQNPYDKTRGSKGAYIRYLRYTVDGWYSKKSEEIRKQIDWEKIFPEDAPVGDYDEFNERDMKIAFMATGIERRSRAAMIEESEAGNEKTKTTGS